MTTMRILPAWKSFSLASTQLLAYLMSQGKLTQSNSGQVSASSAYCRGEQETDPSSELRSCAVEESLYWSCLKSEL
jgi:hypothetical protein